MRVPRVYPMIVLAFALCLAHPLGALAWGTGAGSVTGAGTHQWILRAGDTFATRQGIDWLDLSVALSATVEPDRIAGDNPNHNYDRWGTPYGTADTRVAELYAEAVQALRNNDRTGASRAVGLLAHYYADVCEPFRTDDSSAEAGNSRRFEREVDWLLLNPANAGWAVYDGYQRASSPAKATATAAANAHRSYATLVSQYAANGFDSTAASAAKSGVNAAANGLADLITSVQQDAAETSVSPNVMAHQGVAFGNGYYYIFHTTWITRYDGSWTATGTNAYAVGWWNGFIQPHLGDGCYYDGKLYVVAENYPTVSSQQIMVFDANSMTFTTRYPIFGIPEVSSVTVADLGDGPLLVVSSYWDRTRLYKYRMSDGASLGQIPLSPAPAAGIQGLTYHDGLFYICSDNTRPAGRLYTATPEGATRLVYTNPAPGVHEGLDFDGSNLLWLVDTLEGSSRVYTMQFPGFLMAPH